VRRASCEHRLLAGGRLSGGFPRRCFAESAAEKLSDALERDADTHTRAAQAKTVLEMAVECIQKAHTCIDEQESQDQNLILAYFDRKGDAPRLAR
jgi:hypothetical protein